MTTNSRLFARSVPVVTKHFYCCWLAFLSGAIGLTSQIVWLRKFGQVFGGTVQAASVVIAATLAGLAMGAYFLGQRADSKDKPFRFAGWLMVLTGTVLAAWPKGRRLGRPFRLSCGWDWRGPFCCRPAFYSVGCCQL